MFAVMIVVYIVCFLLELNGDGDNGRLKPSFPSLPPSLLSTTAAGN